MDFSQWPTVIITPEYHKLSHREGNTIATNTVTHSLAEVTIHWTPTQDQSGDHVICIMAVDSLLASSTPYCIPVSVTDIVVEVSINWYNSLYVSISMNIYQLYSRYGRYSLS